LITSANYLALKKYRRDKSFFYSQLDDVQLAGSDLLCSVNVMEKVTTKFPKKMSAPAVVEKIQQAFHADASKVHALLDTVILTKIVGKIVAHIKITYDGSMKALQQIPGSVSNMETNHKNQVLVNRVVVSHPLLDEFKP
jgi:hypothetical protein